MTWDPVPLMIGNGAVHSDAVFRLGLYAAFNGNEGIIGPSDLRVTAQATPNASVNVGVGAAAIIARGSGQRSEAYACRKTAQETIAITPTGSGGGRSDLIIARIEDPNYSGSPFSAPSNLATGPYVFTRVISGVPSTTDRFADLNLGQAAIALARIDIPANTSAITSAMITNLRTVANPRRERKIYTNNPGATYTIDNTGSFSDWFGSWMVRVPPWAVRAIVLGQVQGARLDRASSSVAGTVTGYLRVALGTTPTQGVAYDLETSPSNVVARYQVGASDNIVLPDAIRDTVVQLRLQGVKSSGNKSLYVDTLASCSIDIEFQESAS